MGEQVYYRYANDTKQHDFEVSDQHIDVNGSSPCIQPDGLQASTNRSQPAEHDPPQCTSSRVPFRMSNIKVQPSATARRSLPQGYASSTRSGSSSKRSDLQNLPISRTALRLFEHCPSEVYECITRQLRTVHTSAIGDSCPTCVTRDLCALALVSRLWNRTVVKELYDSITIPISVDEDPRRRSRSKQGSRLSILRRTLRARDSVAKLVRSLHFPVLKSRKNESLQEPIVDLIASVVMSCPNLHRLQGFHIHYTHDFNRLTHALSTRRKLREHVWLIGENSTITKRSFHQLAPGLMDLEQKSLFLGYHDRWTSLTTLLIHTSQHGILEKDIFTNRTAVDDGRKFRDWGILHRMPSLQHLCLASLDMDDFDDATLQRLPPLQSLRLQDLEGVTFWGLSEFARTKNAFGIQKLGLVNLDVLYLSAIANLLLRLKNLLRFTLVQDTSPEVPVEEVVMQPIMASARLEFLHWEILEPGTANEYLASSIRASGFPRLSSIRAPADHTGVIQALCKPRAQIERPSDWSAKAIVEGIRPGGLRAARRVAQQRLEDAWTTVQYKLVVEEGGTVNTVFDFSGFMGTVGSRIEYSLEPDVQGSDHALVDFDDLQGLVDHHEPDSWTCDGAWNSQHQAGPEWWSHDRVRQKSFNLSNFF